MAHLRGMTWSHPRGVASVRAATDEFRRTRPDVTVEWATRSLQEFEDVPVAELARRYDLIAMDHPFTGGAATSGALVPVDEVLPADALRAQQDGAVGPGGASYRWEGRQWALAMDAAAQVSAYRPDLLPGRVPRTWDEVFALLDTLPAGIVAELPANPTHLWSSFLSLCHHVAPGSRTASGPQGRPGWWPDTGIEPDVAAAALDLLRRLVDRVDPISLERDPIATLDAMAAGAPIAYVPLVFGYSNYARDGHGEHLVRFADAPSPGAEPAGTMIGGVGLAISARCADVTAAAALAGWITSPHCQAGTFLHAGGQPAHRSAWTDPAANALTNGFFADTLRTLDASFVRARVPGYPAFQRRAGDLLHRAAARREPAGATVEELTALWLRLCCAPPGTRNPAG